MKGGAIGLDILRSILKRRAIGVVPLVETSSELVSEPLAEAPLTEAPLRSLTMTEGIRTQWMNCAP